MDGTAQEDPKTAGQAVRGWRGRIGFLWPHDGRTDDEYWAYLPDGVALLVARYKVQGDEGELGLAALERWADPLLLSEAAGLVRLAQPGVLATGDHAASFVRGPACDRALVAAMREACGVHATTPAAAIRTALRLLSVRRIALASPYPAEVTARLVDALGADGIDVIRAVGLDLAAESAIADLLPGFWHGVARQADHPQAEAVLLAGGGIRTAGMLGVIERDLGKPVLAAPATLVWHACRLLDVALQAPEHGCLFDRYGAATLPEATV